MSESVKANKSAIENYIQKAMLRMQEKLKKSKISRNDEIVNEEQNLTLGQKMQKNDIPTEQKVDDIVNILVNSFTEENEENKIKENIQQKEINDINIKNTVPIATNENLNFLTSEIPKNDVIEMNENIQSYESPEENFKNMYTTEQNAKKNPIIPCSQLDKYTNLIKPGTLKSLGNIEKPSQSIINVIICLIGILQTYEPTDWKDDFIKIQSIPKTYENCLNLLKNQTELICRLLYELILKFESITKEQGIKLYKYKQKYLVGSDMRQSLISEKYHSVRTILYFLLDFFTLIEVFLY